MNSVRDRVERPLREQPEQIVETGTRRVALGASGPTMSTRMQADFAASQNEVTVRPREVTSSASVQYEIGGFSRTRDRMEAEAASKPEAMRPKTDAELAGEAGIAEHQKRQAREAAAEARAYATGRKVDGYQRMIDEARAACAAEDARRRAARESSGGKQ